MPTARLINISTRAQVGTGANIMIAGFVVGGSGSETVLVRADGPALSAFGLTGVLAQPVLSVLDGTGKVLATNTKWGSNADPSQISAAATAVGAFGLASGSYDSALIATLPPGAYTAEVSGAGGTTGIALAEIYEVSYSGTRLINISTRAPVGTGANLLIAGFVIGGNANEKLLVRADGPALTAFGVEGALSQPSLSVMSGSAVVAENTAWGTATDPDQIASIATAVGAFSLVQGSADSAAVLSLSPGAYTMEVGGVGTSTGVGLAEVYEVMP